MNIFLGLSLVWSTTHCYSRPPKQYPVRTRPEYFYGKIKPGKYFGMKNYTTAIKLISSDCETTDHWEHFVPPPVKWNVWSDTITHYDLDDLIIGQILIALTAPFCPLMVIWFWLEINKPSSLGLEWLPAAVGWGRLRRDQCSQVASRQGLETRHSAFQQVSNNQSVFPPFISEPGSAGYLLQTENLNE